MAVVKQTSLVTDQFGSPGTASCSQGLLLPSAAPDLVDDGGLRGGQARLPGGGPAEETDQVGKERGHHVHRGPGTSREAGALCVAEEPCQPGGARTRLC